MTYNEALDEINSNYRAARRPHWSVYNILAKSMGGNLLIYSTAKTFDRIYPLRYSPSEEDMAAKDWELAPLY